MEWLTEYGKGRLTTIFGRVNQNDNSNHHHQQQQQQQNGTTTIVMMNEFQQVLHNASKRPIIYLKRIIPIRIIQYIRSEYFTNSNRSCSSNSTTTDTTTNMDRYKKRFFDHHKNVLSYLFQLHNGKGLCPRRLVKEITDCFNYLWMQQVVRQHRRNIQSNNGINLLDDDYFDMLDRGGVMTEAMLEDSMQQDELYRNGMVQERLHQIMNRQVQIQQEQQNFQEQIQRTNRNSSTIGSSGGENNSTTAINGSRPTSQPNQNENNNNMHHMIQLDGRNSGNGRSMSSIEQELRQCFNDFMQQAFASIQQQLPTAAAAVPAVPEVELLLPLLPPPPPPADTVTTTETVVTDVFHRTEDGTEYLLHFYDNTYKRVPPEWRFPCSIVSDVWRQWWIGDTVRNIPPLRYLQIHDVKHLDDVPIVRGMTGTAEELSQESTTERYPIPRRKSIKMLSDMKFLMEYIREKVMERELFPEQITIATVDRMYVDVADLLNIHNKNKSVSFGSLIWSKAVNILRDEERKVTGGDGLNANNL